MERYATTDAFRNVAAAMGESMMAASLERPGVSTHGAGTLYPLNREQRIELTRWNAANSVEGSSIIR